MRDARTHRPIEQVQTRRSSLAGFVVILALGFALVLAGCALPDRTTPLAPPQDHVRLPSLAPVVQAVIPAVVHVSAVQSAGLTNSGEQNLKDLPRSAHQGDDRGLPPAALDELLRRFFGMPEMPVTSIGSGFIIDPDGRTSVSASHRRASIVEKSKPVPRRGFFSL